MFGYPNICGIAMRDLTPEDLTEPRRADAQRNREAVLEAAMKLLAARPAASMQEVAEASGVGRTTVYRHFANRDELLMALFARVVEDGRVVTAEAAASPKSVADTLRDLGPKIVEIGERYRFLDRHRYMRDTALATAEAATDDPLEGYLGAAQSRGEVRTDMSVGWMVSMIRGLSYAATDEVIAGRVASDEAGRMLGELMARAFVSEPPA